MGIFDKIHAGLARTRESLARQVLGALGKGKLDEDTLEALEEKLLTADVGVETAQVLLEGLRKRARGRDAEPSQILRWLAEEARDILREPPPLPDPLPRPWVILLVGVNGAGKTTSIAKIAHRFKSEGKSVLLAACD